MFFLCGNILILVCVYVCVSEVLLWHCARGSWEDLYRLICIHTYIYIAYIAFTTVQKDELRSERFQYMD